MERSKLQIILNDIGASKIAIVGDFCLDAYWFVDESMGEISVETNLATRPVSEQRYSLGGAGNVAANLVAMRVRDIRVFGVIGTDPFGTEMIRKMNAMNVNADNLIVQEQSWSTHTYSKPYIGNSELNRIDFGNFNNLHDDTADRLIQNLNKTIPEVDIVIINQQVPSGIHTEYFREQLANTILRFPEKTFITDSRRFNDYYTGTIRKMNDTEAMRLCGYNRSPDEVITFSELETAVNELYKRFEKPVFVTRGSKGSVTVDENGISEIPGLMILSKVDTVGAGDSYLAGVASTLAAGNNIRDAAYMGTLVAGVTVQKLFQTGTANPDEILAIGNDPDFIYSPDLAEDSRHANYHGNHEIEIINKWNHTPAIVHAIFDHDGTVSTLREGWEHIMAPVMIKAILGEKLNDADESLYREVKQRVNEYIDKTTGIQTLIQMNGLIELIREFGCIQNENILDAKGYKKIYNDELLKMIGAREKKFRAGELELEDLTMKNAVPFLQKLYDSGIRLYLASGTDTADVENEARVLGYDHFFEGRIYGAVGDITVEAKKIVLDQILDFIGNSASGKVVTFGDGPVEIRETKKRGGFTVGVASNELRRYGLNEHKRARLVKAGADLIIPDFSQYQFLLKFLNINS